MKKYVPLISFLLILFLAYIMSIIAIFTSDWSTSFEFFLLAFITVAFGGIGCLAASNFELL